jgi:hypothetical protein
VVLKKRYALVLLPCKEAFKREVKRWLVDALKETTMPDWMVRWYTKCISVVCSAEKRLLDVLENVKEVIKKQIVDDKAVGKRCRCMEYDLVKDEYRHVLVRGDCVNDKYIDLRRITMYQTNHPLTYSGDQHKWWQAVRVKKFAMSLGITQGLNKWKKLTGQA